MTDVVIYRSDVRTGHKEVKEMKQYLSAIIEDDPEYSQYLIQCLERYGAGPRPFWQACRASTIWSLWMWSWETAG